jgi:hypothetical protein
MLILSGVSVAVHSKRILLLVATAFLALPVSAGAQSAHLSYAEYTLGSGFFGPEGVAVDGSGNVYIADTNNSAVKEIPYGCASASCVITLWTGTSYPIGVAVDGSGNVYVAGYSDSGVGSVSKIPVNGVTVTLGGGFKLPAGVAVDGSGNVYVADRRLGVEEIPSGCLDASCVKTLGGGFQAAQSVAVDGSGNVYVADAFNGSAVFEIPSGCASSSCVESWGGGFAVPYGIAVDGSGNLYVADQMAGGSGAVFGVPHGCKSASCVRTLSGGFNSPSGIALDGNGNVYVGDSSDNRVVIPVYQGVGTFPIGQTAWPLTATFTFDSGGTIGSPVALTQGASGQDFAVASGGTCTAGTDYSTGATCTVNASFTPKFPGLRKGAIELQNGSGHTVATGYISGIGLGPQVSFPPGSQVIMASLGDGNNQTKGIAVDGSGNIFFADPGYGFRDVYEITAASNYTSIVGLGGNTPWTFFMTPWGVAVDGSGNLFVADNGNDGVPCNDSDANGDVFELLAEGGYTTVIKLGGSDFDGPTAVAVDGSGNVLVADNYNRIVKEIPPGCTSPSCVRGFNQHFGNAQGVAVDGSGNVFVAETGYGGGNYSAVEEMLAVFGSVPGSPSTNLIGGGYDNRPGVDSPNGLAVEGNGNVVAVGSDDWGHGVLWEILAAGGFTAVDTLNSGSYNPQAVAVDGIGNYYVTLLDKAVKFDFADAPSLNFGPIMVGESSAAQTVTIRNIGNAPLIFTHIRIPANFTPVSADTSCSTSSPLAAGASCSLGFEFSPTSGGSISGSVSLTDNALNASPATQTILLQGTGTVGLGAPPAAPTYTLTAAASSVTIAAGNSSTVTLDLTSTNYAGTVPFTTSVTSSDGADSNVLASATPVTLTSGGSGSSTLTITTSARAANHAPAVPWKSGGAAMLCAVLLGVPFTVRRKRALAVLLTAVTISLAGLLTSCGGSSSSTPKAARTYTVTVTPTGTGTVTDAQPVTITVTVP